MVASCNPVRDTRFPSAREDARNATVCESTPQTESTTYRLAFADDEFLLRDELRPVRLQLELLKPELALQEAGIESTIVVFGSARLPDPESAARRRDAAEAALAAAPQDETAGRQLERARKACELAVYYEHARRFAQLASTNGAQGGRRRHVVVTGGGHGIMEAANRGAHDVGAPSIGLNIVLPHEQAPNRFITPELCFQFHYFALRKMHFLLRAHALVIFPGGFGTLDELFETLTLIQTGKIDPFPVLLFGRDYWRRIIDLEALVEAGMIDEGDLDIVHFVETAEEAWAHIAALE